MVGADAAGTARPRARSAESAAGRRAGRQPTHLAWWSRGVPSFTQHVAGVPDGVDQARFAGRLQFGAELPDVDGHQVRLSLEVVAPDLLQDVGVGKDSPGVTQEE